MNLNRKKWRFAVDRGGTFTDVVGIDPSGDFHSLKLLSQFPGQDDASIEGIRRMLGLSPGEALPEDRIEGIRFGTTVATNALLERKGGRVALLITKGFSDLLEIGYQDRPDIFRLCIEKSSPLYSAVVEVEERIDCRGNVVKDFNAESMTAGLEKLRDEKIDTIAVVLMHSWINPRHELLCKKILRKRGFSHIFLSHETVNLIKIVSRGQSTLVDAYLSCVLAQYMEGIKKLAGRIKVEFMQSSGLLSRPETFTGKNALLSGPAGGLVAVARTAEEKGIRGVIGFDMGGTSTDVSRYDGIFAKKHEQIIGGVPLQIEMLDINSVAAGGGSILNFDGQKMTAGPESAGAHPGPACYGFGGPLTVTDANLMTGRLIPAYFPKKFGRDRKSFLSADIVEEKFRQLSNEINRAMGTDFNLQETAAGFLRVANEKMALAIKEISVSRGFDLRNYPLVCFGGAGAQHACSIASLLDIETIVIHPLSSVMSAYGIGLSKPARKSVRSVLRIYTSEAHEKISLWFNEMEEDLYDGSQHKSESCIIKREIDLRPKGAETYLTMEYAGFGETISAFKERYRRLFGFGLEKRELEIVNIRVELVDSTDFFSAYKPSEIPSNAMPKPVSYQELYCSGGSVKVPVYLRESLPPFIMIQGPVMIIDSNFTVVVECDFAAETDASGIMMIKRVHAKKVETSGILKKPDPVLLEVFNNIFMGIATEMGLILKNTAFSVNMKERLDFSCAVFDSDGGLVANAPHIPVHLGSMADTVKALIEDKRNTLKPGDVYLTNNPYKGGSHLSDMTVVCPVFSEENELIFFTAARGHHSDVGGTTPGSIPPSAAHIDEEGVMVDGFLLVEAGTFREDAIINVLSNHKFPARNIPERLADFKAQLASCQKGVREIRRTIERYGLTTVMNYMGHIQDNAQYSIKKSLQRFLLNGSFASEFSDFLDDGTPVHAALSIEGGTNPPETLRAVIDFTGTGKQHDSDNLNAPLSVVRSAVMYVLRSLIGSDIPLNSGCLNPVKIIVPEGTIVNPFYPAPVASGNVETSQRIVDVLLGALGIAAASQGTMNNLLFEVEGEVPYYETIAGGAGAMKDCPGASGVQVHMTNTRITDPEVLEFRHPGVRLEQFTLRKGSGGKGAFPGGDGVIREITFLKPATVSIISERRCYAPYGAKGGEAGEKGKNICKKAQGDIEELGHREVRKIGNGDSIIIKTPGGGGYGQFP